MMVDREAGGQDLVLRVRGGKAEAHQQVWIQPGTGEPGRGGKERGQGGGV